MDDHSKVRTIVRFRDAVISLLNMGGAASFQYRLASKEILRLVLGREPTDEELDVVLCDR
jgi:hypothetical protein